ncbi:ABC transporter substrate-binding protein [Jiangella asiatica]|uniref:Extracellular solute-binding protein n=1 Tax=Jiangella asiatica TaxID=2530372 RepID=A0A4R5CS65_9ACTN|nr:extracellular solute-binding protein [Jiangella asiatica]TDE03116.1 extracellular solute-binding protein [Jiangella asiatica]
MRARTGLAAAAVVLGVVAGCGQPPEEATDDVADEGLDALVEAAQEEGRLVHYSVETDEVNAALATAFEAEYGIEVETLRLTTGPMLERFAGEQRAGVTNADAIQVVDQNVWEEYPEWFVELSDDEVPGWSDYPEQARHGTCADMMYSIGGITYNSKAVPPDKVPDSYEDLLDPYWRGKLLLTDPRSTPAYMGWASLMEQTYGIEFLQQLAGQDLSLVESASPGAQQVAAGAFQANVMAHLSNSTELRSQGAPLEFAIVDDPPAGLGTCAGIPANAPHPNAARLFMHWRLTPEAHNAACAVVEIGSPLAEADQCARLPENWEPTPLDAVGDPEAERRLLQALGIE